MYESIAYKLFIKIQEQETVLQTLSNRHAPLLVKVRTTEKLCGRHKRDIFVWRTFLDFSAIFELKIF